MDLTQALILAVTQGLTEFLPVSSSGHLLAVRLFLGIPDTGGVAFDALLHLGTLGAVLAYYWRTWVNLARALVKPRTGQNPGRQTIAALAVATVPAAIVGYAFEDAVEAWFRTPTALAASLAFTGTVLIVLDRLPQAKPAVKPVKVRDAGLIGLAQVLALIPGVSRSGITIAAGRWRGLGRRQATKFSFLMSAPIIAGAGLAHVPDVLASGLHGGGVLLLALLVSFGSGLAAISWFVRVVEKVSLLPFAVYLFGLAASLAWYG